ncbi:MAG: hypothetical protein Q8P24_00655, partial [Desulfobacterales bacterium]|nr:hypothetical protein [Desulfobacterales bacterium]
KKLEAELVSAGTRFEDLQESRRRETAVAAEARGRLEKDLAAEQAGRKETEKQVAAAWQQISGQSKTISDLEQAKRGLEGKLAAVHREIAALETAPAGAPAEQAAKMERIQKPGQVKPAEEKNMRAESVASLGKHPEPSAPVATAPDFNDIPAFVRSWAEAWEEKNIEAYLAHYSTKFQLPGAMSISSWQEQRRQRMSKPGHIKIDIDHIVSKPTGDSSVRATFIQKYKSASYSDRVLKTLDMQWTEFGWVIVKETGRAL